MPRGTNTTAGVTEANHTRGRLSLLGIKYHVEFVDGGAEVWFMYRKLHVNTAGEIYRIEEVPECLE